jgi:hypothetical protein
MTVHKHAANMALYAQDAAETDEPCNRWEYMPAHHAVWYPCTHHPEWIGDIKYRRKPRTIRIGERDVPAPMTTAPERGAVYFTPGLVCIGTMIVQTGNC